MTKKGAAEVVARSIIEDSKTAIENIIKSLKKEKIELDSIPERITEEEVKNFTIFIFFLETRALFNLFSEPISKELYDLSTNCLSTELGMNKKELLKEVSIYEDKFSEDIERGANYFDSSGVLAILAEKTGFKKTVGKEREKSFSPLLTTALSIHIGEIIGRWKKVNESYSLR